MDEVSKSQFPPPNQSAGEGPGVCRGEGLPTFPGEVFWGAAGENGDSKI